MMAEFPEAFSKSTRLDSFFVECFGYNGEDCDVPKGLAVVGPLFQACATLRRVSLLADEKLTHIMGHTWQHCRVDGGEVVVNWDAGPGFGSWRVSSRFRNLTLT